MQHFICNHKGFKNLLFFVVVVFVWLFLFVLVFFCFVFFWGFGVFNIRPWNTYTVTMSVLDRFGSHCH